MTWNRAWQFGVTLVMAASMSLTVGAQGQEPCEPVLIGEYDAANAAYSVVVEDDVAYVANAVAGSGLVMLDVSDPASPVLLGTYVTTASNVQVVDHLAYISAFSNGVEIVDVSDPTTPTLLGAIGGIGQPRSLYVSGNVAYACDMPGHQLRIIDVSDPTDPMLLASYPTGGRAIRVFIDGNTAYVTDDIGLLILDVTDPATPAFLGRQSLPSWGTGILVVDDIAYVGASYAGFYLVDVSDPTAPAVLGSVLLPNQVGHPVVVGETVLVGGYAGLFIIDVSDPTIPTVTASYDTPGSTYWVSMAGTVAYLADYGSVLILDVSSCTRQACVADLSADGTVGFEDLSTLLSKWGWCEACPADINGTGDGWVGFDDLVMLLAAWGPC